MIVSNLMTIREISVKLKDQAEQAELKIALPRIDAALGETG